MFEFIENVTEIQSSQGIFAEGFALHKKLVNKVLEALMENEAQCVQDLKNEKANDTISSVTEYLVTHHGSPATVESLAKTRPFLESYIAM